MELNDLIELGLTEGESKVYLALLNLGSSTVGPIVKESRLAYSNIYEVLERLIEKGLVSFVTKEKTRYFQAAEPYQFNDYLEKKKDRIKKQKERLKSLMPTLLSIANTKEEKLEAEIFSGFKAVKTSFAKMIEGADEGDYMFFYTNYENHPRNIDDFFISLLPILYKPKVNFRGVAQKIYEDSKFFKKISFVKMKLVDFPILGNMDICRNKVLITTWGKKPVSFLIHSKEVADNLRNYFEFVWNSS